MAWYDDLLSPFRTAEYESGDVVGYDYDVGKILGAGTSALTAGAQIADLLGYDIGGSQQQPAGYQGGIPSYTVARQQVPGTYDPDRRPGSGGQRYFTDVRYDGGDTSAEAAGLEALNRANAAAKTRENVPMTEVYAAREAGAKPVQQLAAGGIASLKKSKYLDGDTDGMADEKPAMIDGEEPALLSDGEFVIPADVVSHLGNGNSDAGAKVLEDMMARVRKARTGSEEQGAQIDPNDFLPV
jgi:hypothetical protein